MELPSLEGEGRYEKSVHQGDFIYFAWTLKWKKHMYNFVNTLWLNFLLKWKKAFEGRRGRRGGGGVLAQGVKQTRTATGIRMRFCYDKDKD